MTPQKARRLGLPEKKVPVDMLHDIVPTQAHRGQFRVGFRLEGFDLNAA